MLILNQPVDIVNIVNSDIHYHDVPFSGSVASFILFCTYCTHCCTHYCGFEHSHGFAMSEWFPQVWPGSSLISSSRSGREAATALSWGAAKDFDILIKTIPEKRGEERDLPFIKAIKGAEKNDATSCHMRPYDAIYATVFRSSPAIIREARKMVADRLVSSDGFEALLADSDPFCTETRKA